MRKFENVKIQKVVALRQRHIRSVCCGDWCGETQIIFNVKLIGDSWHKINECGNDKRAAIE